MKFLDLTSEEIREKRRNERKQFKLDRARVMAEAAAEAESAFLEGREAALPVIPSSSTWKPAQGTTPEVVLSSVAADSVDVPHEEGEEDSLEDLEHLQLITQEAFFLVWGLDCLAIVEPEKVRSFQDTFGNLRLDAGGRTNLFLCNKYGMPFRTSIIHPPLSSQHI